MAGEKPVVVLVEDDSNIVGLVDMYLNLPGFHAG